MRRLLIAVTTAVALLGSAQTALAQSASDFYLTLLRRGIADYDAGRFDAATRNLRIAGFGLLDAVDSYQTAQIYLTLAHDQLKDVEGARAAAKRVIAAERVQRRFAALALPANVRTAFAAAARKVLTAGELAMLNNPAPAATSVPQTASVTPPRTNTTSNPPPRQTNTTTPPRNDPPAKPQPEAPQTTSPPKPQTTTAPTTTTPAKPQPTAPQTTTTPAKPQTTVPQNTIPAKPQSEAPRPGATTPAKPQTTTTGPQTAPATPQTAPPRTTTTAPQSPNTKPQTPNTTRPAVDAAASFTAGERALGAADLYEARRVYRALLDTTLDHAQYLRVAEGLYRARDFAGAIGAFERAGALRRGEEPYRYYLAVALYETARFAEAKKELAAVLPFIQITPDVERYRVKIHGAID